MSNEREKECAEAKKTEAWKFDAAIDSESEEAAFGYIDGLAERFEQSPEFLSYAKGDGGRLTNIGLVFELGYQYEGLLPSELNDLDLKDILLNIFPRKVSCPAE